jgi:hypothetical protein
VEALVDGVAGALGGSTVAAPLRVAIGAGALGGAAVGATGAIIVPVVCGEEAGDCATDGGGSTPAQPTVRSTKRSPTLSATRINGTSARISMECSFIGFSSVKIHEYVI